MGEQKLANLSLAAQGGFLSLLNRPTSVNSPTSVKEFLLGCEGFSAAEKLVSWFEEAIGPIDDVAVTDRRKRLEMLFAPGVLDQIPDVRQILDGLKEGILPDDEAIIGCLDFFRAAMKPNIGLRISTDRHLRTRVSVGPL